MISEAHFNRCNFLMFSIGGFAACVAIGLGRGGPGTGLPSPPTRTDFALAIVCAVFALGSMVSAWLVMRNNDRERDAERANRYPWITADYLNDLHAKCVAENDTE